MWYIQAFTAIRLREILRPSRLTLCCRNLSRKSYAAAARWRLFALLGAALLWSCATTPVKPLPTVEQIDLNRYAGTWYEIALLPNRFQRQCVADTQARYTIDADAVKVVNRCRRADGEVETIEGIAYPVQGSNNAKLRVSFFRPFYGDYWILAIDADYRFVLVGAPSRRFAWVLSRTPQLDQVSTELALAKAYELGFDRNAFVRTPQTRQLED
jgi:apolipoprotein D and lipocalin family protein